MKEVWMRKAIVLVFLFLVFTFGKGVLGQIVASGWEIAGQIPAGDSLWGGWDLIVDLDLDNDGQKEFIVSRDPSLSSFLSNQSAGQLVDYYEVTGNNQVELRWSFQAPITNNAGNVYTAIAVGDLDADNFPELWFGTPLAVSDDPPNPKGMYVFEFDGSNFPVTPSEQWNFGRPDNHEFKVSGLAIGDPDNDGDQEIVIQSRGDDGPPGLGGGRTMMVVNSGGIDIGIGLAAFSIEFENSSNHTGGVVYDPRIVDFDDDGFNEIWVFTWDFFSLAIYESHSINSYDLEVDLNQVFSPEDFGHRRGMQFYDVDGNNKLEFYTAGIQPDNGPNSRIFYIGNTGDVSTLTSTDIIMLGGKDQPSDGSAIGDLDGNGLMDFLYTGRAGNNSEGTRIYRMEYSGLGSLSDSASYNWDVLFESANQFADLRNIAITDLDGDHKTDVLFTRMNTLADTEAIVYILENTTTGLKDPQPFTVTNNFVLEQNYPNPFNPTTTIKFKIREAGNATISVYNSTGEKISDIFEKFVVPGSYEVQFDGSKLSSGMYFYTLESEDFRSTRIMSLIK
jgi:hypothetical protein